jgi:hypothetical protein
MENCNIASLTPIFSTNPTARVKDSMRTPTNSRKVRIYLVSLGFGFALLLVALAKLNVSGPVLAGIFVLGWVVLAVSVIKFFSRYDPRA